MARPQITMWSYVWDFAYDELKRLLHYLKREIGLTAVSVATSYHSVEHLRPHGTGPFIYRATGSVYFPPDRERYHRTPSARRSPGSSASTATRSSGSPRSAGRSAWTWSPGPSAAITPGWATSTPS